MGRRLQFWKNEELLTNRWAVRGLPPPCPAPPAIASGLRLFIAKESLAAHPSLALRASVWPLPPRPQSRGVALSTLRSPLSTHHIRLPLLAALPAVGLGVADDLLLAGSQAIFRFSRSEMFVGGRP